MRELDAATFSDAIAGGPMLVDVQLREREPTTGLGLERGENRLDGPARPAPGRPEVDEDRAGGDRVGKVRCAQFAHPGIVTLVLQRRPASAATRSTGTLTTASRKIARLIFE